MERELHRSTFDRLKDKLPFHSPGSNKTPENIAFEESDLPINIRYGILPSDLEPILEWAQDPETQGHLDPLPYLPDWKNPKDVEKAKNELADYYINKGDDIKKIMPIVATDQSGMPLGVLTIRWRGDPFNPVDVRVPSIERLIVDPNNRKKGIGTKLIERASKMAFTEYKYRNGLPAKEIRAWVMTEEANGKPIDYQNNLNLFFRLGFYIYSGSRAHYEHPSWDEYLKKRNMPIENRGKALWLTLKRDDWIKNHDDKNTRSHSVV